MLTARFDLRRTDLEWIFSKQRIIDVWRHVVKDQLRKSEWKDLFDYYDFNYNIEERSVSIRNEILNGTYKISQPLIYRVEKKLGVCRHVIVPQPIDALILQVLTEAISDSILKSQPSDKAYYSRDRHNVRKPHEIEEYGLSWHQQWRKLQKDIYEFAETKKLVIVTDLSNYYDSVNLDELRKVFTSYSQIPEVVVDLIFKIVEDICWRPDYLPSSKRGLPTTNIEGVRLLAHSFLFEIDNFLKKSSKNSFTRWMDDFVIGADEKKEAILMISSMSDMLKSRGLALNLSKTNIFTAAEAFYNFQIKTNRYLDNASRVKKTDAEYEGLVEEMHKKFIDHFEDKNPKYWDKIAKRYITFFARNKSAVILTHVTDLYLSYPGLRTNFIYYLSELGYNLQTASVVLKVVTDLDVFDDISLFQIVSLVTDWNIPDEKESREFIRSFDSILTKLSFARNTPTDFVYILWFRAKYNHAEDLLNFIVRFQNLWQSNSYLRRQATAVLPRLFIYNKGKVSELLTTQISSGVASTISIASQIAFFSTLEFVEFKLNSYLFHPNQRFNLQKFLVLCAVLNSDKVRHNSEVRKKIRTQIKDAYYVKWLKEQYNISFEEE
jgi:Reverse transcriptase (RNA-dependent DNA polymerase)